MKLNEFMGTIKDNRVIGIGAKNNFLFIGTADEWWKFCDVIDEDYKRKHEMAQAENERRKKKTVPYISLKEREVKKSYVTDIYRIFMVVIEGKESGKFWFKHEFDREYYGDEWHGEW